MEVIPKLVELVDFPECQAAVGSLFSHLAYDSPIPAPCIVSIC